jgi:hypothetical protein
MFERSQFSLIEFAQTDSGAHPTPSSMGTVGFFTAAKRPGREADHSLLSRAEVKNEWSYTSSFSACLHGVPCAPVTSH